VARLCRFCGHFISESDILPTTSIPELAERGKFLPHIFSFLTCIFSPDDEKKAESRSVDEKRKSQNPGKDMWQSMLVLPVSVYRAIENLYVRREKLFDK